MVDATADPPNQFRNTSVNGTEEHTKLQKEFTSYLAIASNVPNALFVILNVLYGRRFGVNNQGMD